MPYVYKMFLLIITFFLTHGFIWWNITRYGLNLRAFPKIVQYTSSHPTNGKKHNDLRILITLTDSLKSV